jgi:hypothetical protein
MRARAVINSDTSEREKENNDQDDPTGTGDAVTDGNKR